MPALNLTSDLRVVAIEWLHVLVALATIPKRLQCFMHALHNGFVTISCLVCGSFEVAVAVGVWLRVAASFW